MSEKLELVFYGATGMDWTAFLFIARIIHGLKLQRSKPSFCWKDI